MELGEKIRLARLESGLSQRALAGDAITRNMLSQIEHGTARPSMATLQYLAGKLEKPVSYFLEENAVVSPNQEIIAQARRFYDAGEDAQALQALEGYRSPDPIFDREKALLWNLLHLRLAEEALRQGQAPYALSLLEKAQTETAYCGGELKRRRLLLLGRLPGQEVSDLLPSLDEELLLRAEEALENARPDRAAQLLDAVEDQAGPRWNFLRGQAYLDRKRWQDAAFCLHRAEAAYPRTAALLEICYRELGEYKLAYEYARKQR